MCLCVRMSSGDVDCTYCVERMCRVGQNRILTPYVTVHLVISLPKIPYIHRIYMVLANPTNMLWSISCVSVEVRCEGVIDTLRSLACTRSIMLSLNEHMHAHPDTPTKHPHYTHRHTYTNIQSPPPPFTHKHTQAHTSTLTRTHVHK